MIFQLLEEWNPEKFLEISQKIAGELYTLMNQNIDIPAADLLGWWSTVWRNTGIWRFLKMNYKTSYTHLTNADLGK